MTEQIESVDLALEAAQLPGVFARAFNSGNSTAVERLFDQAAIFVAEPGFALYGAELSRSVEESVARGVPLTATPRHTYVTGDIALLIVDWAMDGTGPDGKPVRARGTSTDVAKRGSDGVWRYLIDSPNGTA
nr:nuclear transport factor 2 family protein [Kibdelosporangium sp. MJ126-NF4]CEL18399.1 conserved hypothetical protein [Kibdelosporangium sp. MJ126-NF4]CTQ97882.1 conserved hypothetical protein [Kibdelosporangium sp. MJ126-NF4]